jgi:DNA-binding NarL/FixJ family response regulator
MIYIDTKIENTLSSLKNELEKKYEVKNIDSRYADIFNSFTNKDLLILDVDQFKKIEEIIEVFNVIPKSLKVIAILDKPKLAHGAFLIKKGFKSYLGKKTDKIIIELALKTVMDGNVWLYPQLMNYIINYISVDNDEMNRSKDLDLLTVKEQNVANLVSKCYSNKEIAENLDVQLVTVKKHISSIFGKLNVKDRVSLAILINSQ